MNERTFWGIGASDPDRPAVVEDGGGTTTYGELATLADRLSNGLRAIGLAAGDTVAVLLSNRVEFLALQLATHQIGLVLAPLNRHLTGHEAGYVLGDSGARVVVADVASAPAAREAADLAGLAGDARFGIGPVPGFRPFTDLLGAAERPTDRISGSLLLYSSGTTGKPKGIRRPLTGAAPEAEHDAMAAQLIEMGMTPGGVYLGTGPLYHSAPNSHAIGALHLGQTVVLSSGFDAEHILDLIRTHRVTDAFMVPTMMHRLVTVPVTSRARYDVSSMRVILQSGAICPIPTKRAMIEWFGPILYEFYGASESGAITSIDSHSWLQHQGSVGRPAPGKDVKVRDEHGNELPPGTPGLLYLLTGRPFEYQHDPDKTARSHRDGYFVPGDIGYVDEDGWLYLCDRRTDMIISGGVNIYPAEIESELLGHDVVLDAAVFGVPDDEWGQQVVALIELREGIAGDPAVLDSVLAHCRRRLARFKVPRVLEVVEQLPRTPAGKINRVRLREHYQMASGCSMETNARATGESGSSR
ncbi:AMP-binding protein [Nocardia spumae]|uniref:AMP-binding protein n=1 Tax=Nocardia spumae TaxID=2887190 RepID=UPI001D133CC2|nr:AMP-binding protein [Nocardia spumae]